jgi:hypothetical protein
MRKEVPKVFIHDLEGRRLQQNDMQSLPFLLLLELLGFAFS